MIGFEALGEATGDDYKSSHPPRSGESPLGSQDKVRILYVLGSEFEKYEADAVWEDTKMGLPFRGKWEWIEIVTDHKGYQRPIKALGFLMPGEVKAFLLAELAAAKDWIAS